MFAYDALFSHLYPATWPGPEEAMRSWQMWRFNAFKTWADAAAKQLGLPVPQIPEY